MDRKLNSDFSQKQVNLHDRVFLDAFAIEQNTAAIIGWFTSIDIEQQPYIHHQSNEVAQHSYSWFREDVATALNAPDEVICRGFICVFEMGGGSQQNHTVTIGEQVLSLEALTQSSPQNSFDNILDMLGDELPNFVQQAHQRSLLLERNAGTSEVIVGAVPEHYIDYALLTEDRYLLLDGWALDAHLNAVILIAQNGHKLTVTDSIRRYVREDIVKHKGLVDANYSAGILIATALDDAIDYDQIQFHYSNGSVSYVAIQPTQNRVDKVEFIKKLLDTYDIYSPTFYEKDYRQALRLLNKLWVGQHNLRQLRPVEKNYGKCHESPRVSVIIPIYGRYDFIQHQINYFSQDADFANHEVIYVLDDPKIAREFAIVCEGVYQTFQHPFKTVFSGSNLGFAGANNLAASYAQGEYILGMNSDVLPSKHGWLSRLVSRLESLPDAGLLGTVLVYEDETVQHIGMQFAQDAYYPSVWMNLHPYKGMPLSLLPEFDVKEVAATTGACFLIRNALFKKLGGLDSQYVIGDFEDSDLCLKVHSSDLKIYVDGAEKLYHLERQSQSLVKPGDWKFKLTILNGLYQKEKWNKTILEVVEKYA